MAKFLKLVYLHSNRLITSKHLFNNQVLPRYFSASAKENMSKNIVWVDMEMTGLDINKDHILEIACTVTDSHLTLLTEGIDIIIHHDDNILNNMNEWSTLQHGETGLTKACRDSSIDLKAAEQKIMDFIQPWAPKNKCPLAGNSVYMDRLFLRKYMPTVDSYLNYRIIDVSTVKELCRRWNHEVYKNMPMKSFQHRALSDITESINELKYYKEKAFILA